MCVVWVYGQKRFSAAAESGTIRNMFTKIMRKQIRKISTKPVQQQRLTLVLDIYAVMLLVFKCVQKHHLNSLTVKDRLWIYIEEDIIETIKFVFCSEIGHRDQL